MDFQLSDSYLYTYIPIYIQKPHYIGNLKTILYGSGKPSPRTGSTILNFEF